MKKRAPRRFSSGLTVLLLLLLPFLGFTSMVSQTHSRVITGVVLEKDTGEPVIGANIYIKGTDQGTISRIDGDFEFEFIPVGGDVLVVSYIGYVTQEIPITSKNSYTIYLQEEMMMLEETVVVAYGVQKKAMVTGAVSSVSSSELATPEEKKSATTWQRSGMKDNSIRLQVGAADYIPLEAAQMAVQVDGFRVRVLMDCFFYNDKGSNLEGTFKLKLPTDATPFYFAFGETEYLNSAKDDKEVSDQFPYTIYNAESFDLSWQEIGESNDRTWSRVKAARMASKQKAAKAYGTTVARGVDPALVEWAGADMFSCKVFPLANHTLHRIVIGYDLNMTEALDFREYILSLPKAEKEFRLDMSVYGSPQMKPSVTPALPVEEVRDNRHYYSVINPEEKEFTIRYDQVAPVLLVQQANDTEEIDIPYFAATYRVDLPEVLQEDLPEDAVFLLDVSLSSQPDKFNVWLKLLEEILENNRDVIKRFSVLTFNIENRWYARHYQKNSYYNRQQLQEYVSTLALEGATDLASALREASNPGWLRKGKNRPKHIFLLSDADCNWGETSMYTFNKLLYPGDRIHTYKTGLSGTNTAILNYLSKSTGGFSFTVTGEEEAKLTAKSFRYVPWTIEQVTFEGCEDYLISGQPTQLYNGQKLIFTGRHIPTGALSIEVSSGEEKRQLVYEPAETISSSLASRVYGQIASSHLENYGWPAEEAATLYSTYYRVPGQYTSLIMLETDWEYHDWGISDHDAVSFVRHNPVADLIEELNQNASNVLLGDGKADFLQWLNKLTEELGMKDFPEEFTRYLEGLSDDVFKVSISPRHYRVLLASQQETVEKEILEDEDLHFDGLYRLARKRAYVQGKPDALKLLSSVIERNPADIQMIQDVAVTAIDWNLPDHAYYMMRRIMDWRQEEGIAYITAADALAKYGNTELALIYYYICMSGNWDSRSGDLPLLAAFKCLHYVNHLAANPKSKISDFTKGYLQHFKETALEILDEEDMADADEADLLIMLSWNNPDAIVDLHVTEPTGEKCYWQNMKTEIGGRLSDSAGPGDGPQLYLLKEAIPGKYKVALDYYIDDGRQTQTKVKGFVEIYRNWGRKNEKITRKTIELRSGDWDDYDEEDKSQTVMTFTLR